MVTVPRIAVTSALLLAACESARPAAPAPTVARPVLVDSSQTALAGELDRAETLGTWADVKLRWQGQTLRWTVTRQARLCGSVDACNIQAFPIQRPAARGWLPALAMSTEQFGRLASQCGDAAQCELTFEGTLDTLVASPDAPTSLRFTDVVVIAAHPV